jgi:hypothetical protein
MYFSLCGLAIAAMAVALVQALRLRRIATGGYVGRQVTWLIVFIAVFLIGYVAAPFLPTFPEVANLLMAGVFLAGALFVLQVMRMFNALVREVMQALRL